MRIVAPDLLAMAVGKRDIRVSTGESKENTILVQHLQVLTLDQLVRCSGCPDLTLPPTLACMKQPLVKHYAIDGFMHGCTLPLFPLREVKQLNAVTQCVPPTAAVGPTRPAGLISAASVLTFGDYAPGSGRECLLCCSAGTLRLKCMCAMCPAELPLRAVTPSKSHVTMLLSSCRCSQGDRLQELHGKLPIRQFGWHGCRHGKHRAERHSFHHLCCGANMVCVRNCDRSADELHLAEVFKYLQVQPSETASSLTPAWKPVT